MGLFSNVKKAFTGSSKKKEKKKPAAKPAAKPKAKAQPKRQTYIQNTNVGKKAAQVAKSPARKASSANARPNRNVSRSSGVALRQPRPPVTSTAKSTPRNKPSLQATPARKNTSKPVMTTTPLYQRASQINDRQKRSNFTWSASARKPSTISATKPVKPKTWMQTTPIAQVGGQLKGTNTPNFFSNRGPKGSSGMVGAIGDKTKKPDFWKEWQAQAKGQRDYKTVTSHGYTTEGKEWSDDQYNYSIPGSNVEVMPKGLKVGDKVETRQGTFTITGIKANGNKDLKKLSQDYDDAVARYTTARASGDNAQIRNAEKELNNISNQMFNARYTYDTSSADYSKQNAAYDTIEKAQKAWDKAYKSGNQKAMESAHKRAEKARATLGFSGGEAGDEFLPFNNPVQQRTKPLSFGERYTGAKDYANTQAKLREDRKYIGDVNTYNQAVQQYENAGINGPKIGRENRGAMRNPDQYINGKKLPNPGGGSNNGYSENNQAIATRKNISDRDRFVYNYLFTTQGKKAADNFLDAAWNLNISQAAAKSYNVEQERFGKEHPVAATAASIVTQPFNTIMGAGQMGYNAVTGSKSDPYTMALNSQTSTMREGAKSTIDSSIGRGAYDIGMNIADMVVDTALGGGIGGAAKTGASTTARLATKRGLVGAAFRRVDNSPLASKLVGKLLDSSAMTTAFMSTQSAYSSYVQSVNSGVATDVALANAVANGALEFASELPAVENLFSLGKLGRMGGAPVSNIGDFAKKLGAQMGIEAGGEAFANLSQTAADSVLMGSRSQVAQLAAEYESQGMSPEEALTKARTDCYWTQTWQSAAMGAIAGGIMSGGAMGVGTVRTGQYIRGNSDFAKDLASVYQTEVTNGKYSEVAETILSSEEGEPVRVGIIKAANMKGELAKKFSNDLNKPSKKEYLYNYVGLDLPNSRTQKMKDIFAEYLGKDTGYASKEFSDAWLRVSMEMRIKLETYKQTQDPQLREELEEYLDNATMLLYSGELDDAAETTSIVRAEVNAALNGINANAGGNNVVSEDIDTVTEQGPVNEEGDPVEEAVLQEETPVAPEDQQAVQQEAETIGDVVEGVADESGVDVQTQAVSSTAFNPEGEQAVAGTTAPTTGTTAGTTNGTISSGGATVTEVPPQTGSTTDGTVSQTGTTGQQAGTQTQFEPTESYPVGQKNRGNVTYHKSAGNPTGRINAARNIMRSNGLSVDSYDVISENDNGTVTFINAKDFDTATEPVILNKVIVDLNNGSIRNETSGTEIIPEKSQLVPADYSGFDVDAQRAREDSWRSQSGIRFNTTRLNDKAYFEETFGDFLRQQEGANNDAERYEETGASRDTAEREPVSSTEGEGGAEEVRGENSEQVISDLPEESESVPVSGGESTGNGANSTEQSDGRNESESVNETQEEETVATAAEIVAAIEDENIIIEDEEESAPVENAVTVETESKVYEMADSFEPDYQALDWILSELNNSESSIEERNRWGMPVKNEAQLEPEDETFDSVFKDWNDRYSQYVQYDGTTLDVKDFNGLVDEIYKEFQNEEYLERPDEETKEQIEEETIESEEAIDSVLEDENIPVEEREEESSPSNDDLIFEQQGLSDAQYLENLKEQEKAILEDIENGEGDPDVNKAKLENVRKWIRQYGGVPETTEREEENGETVLVGENTNGDRGSSGTVQQTEEEQQPEESGTVDSGQSISGRTDDNKAENETDSETDRVGEQSVSQESTSVRPGGSSDTTERERDSSSEYDRASSSTRFYIDRGINEKNPYDQSPTKRVESNIAAIRLLKQLETDGRKATDEEKQTLSMYTGWGGISGAFDTPEKETNVHKRRREELESLLTKEEVESARNSSYSAYYTPYDVIDNVYQIVSQLGVRAGGRVLEPSCGIGAFVGCMPRNIRENSSVTAVELDSVSGKIAQLLYDDVNVEVQDFAKNTGSYSLVVGNVPFAEGIKLMADKSYGKNIRKYDLQDGFITKGLAQLDEGGIMAVLTTHSTLDGKLVKNVNARENFAEVANLIGAIRFPANTFSGTDIVTDLLIFQKKGEGVNNEFAQDFSQLQTMDNGVTVNQYFVDHPEMVLGDFQETENRYGNAAITVVPNEKKIFDAALMSIPRDIVPEYKRNVSEQVNNEVAQTVRKEAEKEPKKQYNGGLSLVDGEVKVYDATNKIYRPYIPIKSDGTEYKAKGYLKNTPECAKDMIEIAQQRDLLVALETEFDGSEESRARIEEEKKKLVDLAEAYLKKHGDFEGKYSKPVANTDPTTYGKVHALYQFKEKNGKKVAEKATLIQEGKIVVPKKGKKLKTKDIKRAIRSSMYEHGYIDVPYLQEVTGKTEEEIISEFDHTVYRDPIKGVYQTQGIYLSGNIYQKIAELKKYIKAHPDEAKELERNLFDLESVKPALKTADTITTQFGSPWVTPEMLEDFFVEKFGFSHGVVRYNREGAYWSGVHFAYDSAIAKWNIVVPKKFRSHKYNNVEWEINGKDLSDYLEYKLNNRELNVYKKVNGKSEKDEIKTEEVLQKANELERLFSEWILQDGDRMNEIESVYNERHNNYVEPTYNVEGFTYEGMNPLIKLNPHQAAGVARATQNQNTLFMHPVGSGKTFTMIASAMEWHRLGQSKKTALVCQKNKLMDFNNDILELYPNAKILLVDEFGEKNRGHILSLIQNNDYDFIVINYEAFKSIPFSEEFMNVYKNEQVSIYRNAIQRLNADGVSKKTVSGLEKSVTKFEQKLTEHIESVTAGMKPTDLFFEDLGIDSIIVDEAQNYKNLPQATSLTRLKGVANQLGSTIKNKNTGKETLKGIGNIHMHMVTSIMNVRKNHIVFATATPVTNTLGELYAYLRYLMPDTLVNSGMDSFDGWVKMFAEKTTSNELTADGRIESKERLGTYINLGALRQFIAPVFDIVSKSSIEKIKIPQADTVQVIAPASEALLMLNKTAEATKEYSNEPGIGLKMYQLTKDAAIDFRLVRQRAIDMGVIPADTTNEELDFPESKLNQCVKQVLEDYEHTKKESGVQVIFLDRGMKSADPNKTPDGSDLSLYDDIIKKLVQGGIPRSEIVSMSGTDTNKKPDSKETDEIMKKVNNGEIRVIIGSSETAGVGINIQTLLYAEHHLDMPDVPADYEQRKGRILRQHNRYADEDFQEENGKDRVKLYHYSTSNSQDAARLQMVDRKASMINAPFEDDNVDTLEDQDDVSKVLQKMSVESANVDQLFELEDERKKVKELTAKENSFRKAQASYARTRSDYAEEKSRLEDNIKRFNKAKDRVSKIPKKPKYTVNGQEYEKMSEASNAAYDVYRNSNMLDKRNGVVVGEIDGIKIEARQSTNAYGAFEVRAEGIPWFTYETFTEVEKGVPKNQNPRYFKPQNIFEIVRNRLDVSIAESRIEQYEREMSDLEIGYQEALKHKGETSPYSVDLLNSKARLAELEREFGNADKPKLEEIHMVSHEDLGRMNGDVVVETIELKSTAEDQRMAKAAAEANKESVEETETVEETEEPIQEATETTQSEQVESEQSELEEEIDEAVDNNGIKFARDVDKSSSKNGKSTSKNDNVESSEEQAEEATQEAAESEEAPIETAQTEETEETEEEAEGPDNYTPPTRGNFVSSRAGNNYGITGGIIENLSKGDRRAAQGGIHNIIGRTKALFKGVNVHTQRYRGKRQKHVLGFYSPEQNMIVLEGSNRLGVLIHELGHYIAKDHELMKNKDVVKSLKNILDNAPGLKDSLEEVGYKPSEMREEVFADFVWHYVVNPDAAWEMGSYAGETNFYEQFEKMIVGIFLARLQNIRRLTLAFNSMSIVERMKTTNRGSREENKKRENPTLLKVLKGERVVEEVDAKWKEKERTILTSIFKKSQVGKEITDRIETLTGEKVSADLNLQYAIDSMTTADATTTQLLKQGFVTPDGKVLGNVGPFNEPIIELGEKVKDLVKKGKLTEEEAEKWYEDFEIYLKSLHSIDWERLGKTTISMDVAGEEGKTTKESNIAGHQGVIDDLDEKYGTIMSEAAEKLHEWWKTFNSIWMIGTGLVDEDLMNELWETYPHYIPMYRAMDDVLSAGSGSKSNSNQVLQHSSKSGSDKDTYSPIENMSMYINRVIEAYHRNEIARTVHDLYRNEDSSIKEIMTDYVIKIDTPESVNVVNAESLKEKLKERLKEETAENLSSEEKARIDKLSEREAAEELARLSNTHIIDEIVDDRLKSFYADPAKAGDDVLIYREGNKVTCYRVVDTPFLMMMESLHPKDMPRFVRGIGIITRGVSALITSLNYLFAAGNVVRDYPHAYVMAKDMGVLSWQYSWRIPVAAAEVIYNEIIVPLSKKESFPFKRLKNLSQTKIYTLYRSVNDLATRYSSGGEGNLEKAIKNTNLNPKGKRSNPVSSIINLLNLLNGIAEAVPRMAQYRATYTKTEGTSKEKLAAAMRTSRDATVDFWQTGTSTSLQTIRSGIPFLNVALQGIKQGQEVLMSKEAWTTKEGLHRIAKVLVMYSLPALIFGLIYRDDKEYKNMENYLKEGYWLIKTSTGEWIRLPKDREFAAAASTPVTMFLESLFDDDFSSEEALAASAEYFAKNWIPSLGTTFQALFDVRANKTWYGAKIVNSYYDSLMTAGYYQEVYDGTTSRFAIAFAKVISKMPMGETIQDKLGVAATPKGIQYVIDQMTGIIGDTIIPLDSPTQGLAGMLASYRNRFVADPDKNDRYIGAAFDIREQLMAGQTVNNLSSYDEKWAEVFNNTMKSGRSNTDKAIGAYLLEHRDEINAGQITFSEAFEEANSKILENGMKQKYFITFGDYVSEMHRVKEDTHLTFEERSKKITDLYKRMGNIAEGMVRDYKSGKDPTKINYGDVILTKEAKEAGFTKSTLAKALTALSKKEDTIDKELYVMSMKAKNTPVSKSWVANTALANSGTGLSETLNQKQKEFLSEYVIGKEYEDYAEKLTPMFEAGMNKSQIKRYTSGSNMVKRYRLVSDKSLTDEQRNMIGKSLVYSSEHYDDTTLQTWRETYQPMIDAGWSATRAEREIQSAKVYDSYKANIVNALRKYDGNEGVQNAMVNLVKGSVKTYDKTRDYYVAYANSGLSPDLIDKAYKRHKEIQQANPNMRAKDTYDAAAKEFASGNDYDLLFNVLYKRS